MMSWIPADWDWWQTLGLIIDYGIKFVAVGIVPEGRKPNSSNAWLLLILLIPVIGLPMFLLMGSPYINRRRHRIQSEATELFNDIQKARPDFPDEVNISDELDAMVRLNRGLTAMPAVLSYHRRLLTDYEETIARIAEVIDQAERWVHVEIYILSWDDTTDVFFRALERAVQRGVQVRLLFDHVGSLKFPGFVHLGRRLDEIGVQWRMMLPILPWRARFRRPDLRNHRKLVVVDGQVGFMGSQNMIDSTYRLPANIKKGRHWVDLMVEMSGPMVESLNMCFAVDWYLESGEELDQEQTQLTPATACHPDDTASVVQVVPSGPGYSTEPNLRMFISIVHHAKKRLILCSPYFIPEESLWEAVTTACYRGVQVDLLVSEKADQFLVHHAQSSYYQGLLEAGVRIFQYPAPAVLHSKFIIADPEGDSVAVMGSSNMDMRSFGLNYEISLMVLQGQLMADLIACAEQYMATSKELCLAEWNKRSLWRRYVDNVTRLSSALQ